VNYPTTLIRLCNFFPAFAAAGLLLTATTTTQAETKPASSVPSVNLIQPADLAATLKGAKSHPVMLQVGFRSMYDQSHIPGSAYAGPGNTPAGLQVLRDHVAKLAKDTDIVIYCGCCPWSRCPNIAAAYDTLQELGFTKVKVLYIADNFGADWVDKGYPATKN
jgi:thiosulfate/3-mercaptopyruvate sulfurtransferase